MATPKRKTPEERLRALQAQVERRKKRADLQREIADRRAQLKKL
jgi:hypothetical protein